MVQCIITGNPLECGCDIYWLLTAHHDYLYRINGALCKDGTPLSWINPWDMEC